MKVDGSMKSLIQGVSQQPARSRLPGQCTEQINMSSNPVDGLTRRPPFLESAGLFDDGATPQFYDYSLGDTPDKNYIVAALPNDIRVFDLNGTEKDVNIEIQGGVPATDYLDGNPLSFTTLDGVTFISNRSKETAMLPATASYLDTGSLVYVLGGAYGRAYYITVVYGAAVVSVVHNTPDGSLPAHAAQITTLNIAIALKAALEANATFNVYWECLRSSDILYIRHKTGQPFTCSTVDSDGGRSMPCVNRTIADAEKLPAQAPEGYVVTVTGDKSSDKDNWYVVFRVNGGASLGAGFGAEGQWVECVAPGIPYKFDLKTMPHVLEYDEDTDEFTLAYGEWRDRLVGDEDSNEKPTFVGKAIEDLGYFQGRLVIASGPAVIMSRTNKSFEFWRQSATVNVDTDPIDIQSTIKGVRKMYRLVPYNRDLVVFSDKGQFIVFGRNSLTPSNASLVLTTAFEAELNANPVAAGRNIFFGIKYGKYAGIREFFTEGNADVNDSRPITQHVLKYLLGNATQLVSSSNFDVLLVRTSVDPRTVYLYEYIWVDEQKAQSSWSKWTVPDDLVYAFFRESIIYLVTKRGNNYILNYMDLDVQNDEGVSYQVKLDRKKTISNVYTTITAPYAVMPTPSDVVMVQGEGCPYPGMRVMYDYAAGVYTLRDDMQGGDVIVGVRYRSSFIPTIPSIKDADGVKIGTGTLTISKFLLNCRETGTVMARVFSKYAPEALIKFTGRFVGNPSTVVGEPVVVDETFIVPFRSNADYAELELYTDSHEPMTMMDIEWMGQYTKKGRRISTGGA